MEMKIDFVTAVPVQGYAVRGDRIVSLGVQTREFRPIEVHKSLYLQFARLDDRPESFVDFMGKFGPLTQNGNLNGELIEHLIELRNWMSHAVRLSSENLETLMQLDAVSPEHRRAIAGLWDEVIERANIELRAKTPKAKRPLLTSGAKERGKRLEWESAASMLKATLRPGAPDGRPTLYLTPDSLADALKLQFYQALSSNSAVRTCEWCGIWFEVGPTGKTRKSRFCSNLCRLHHHRKRKEASK